jgi:hypothetical protein
VNIFFFSCTVNPFEHYNWKPGNSSKLKYEWFALL